MDGMEFLYVGEVRAELPLTAMIKAKKMNSWLTFYLFI